MIDWEKFRRPDKTIDLTGVFFKYWGKPNKFIIAYFSTVETLMPIKSRQAAALAIATARHLYADG